MSSLKFKDKKLILSQFSKTKNISLVTVLIATCTAIGIYLFIPSSKLRAKYQLPPQISLSEWKFQSSNPLDKLYVNRAISSQRYIYKSTNEEVLQIDLLYINGIVKVPQYLLDLGLNSSKNRLVNRYAQETGHYVLFSDQKRAYLSSCINPRGGSTITEDQFMQNRNTYDINPERIISYLLGTTDLRDTRCLFTIMSISLEDNNESNNLDAQKANSLDKSYQKLEKTWINWHKDWQKNFPKN
ncbi:cyanoexosortase A system-associated protein [Pseudanabaena sp. FACHB-1998]|uniref:cyanoexosortase A system-associated protein n=1 Tax=Pseudanabaena sp. FACHB-1998 TaxID=2692858 RepID=UPI001680B9F3|nr:cyanoexosortase A system-associated protein [Pseudanabaena sp. FACHB-1998]MBD2177824.1 cyanoexosortase A system-associated protein [Pseudanabaena sp. FACHB-1998]